MKIKRLELNNFRQFVGKQEMVFSIDDSRNVTFITAQNTTGKTTIIEAFQYLFFGKTNIGEDAIINVDLSKGLKVGEEFEIKVVIEIVHKNKNYTLARTQKIRKHEKKVKAIDDSILSINYKDENGVTKTVLDKQEFINEIMPENLFRYFFFEGEEIERLGDSLFDDNINKNAFANAVKNLLGFNYLYNSIRDIQKTINRYENDLADALEDDKKNQTLQLKINGCNADKEKNIERQKILVEELSKLKEQLAEVNKKLIDNKSTNEKQTERNKLKKQLDEKYTAINNFKNSIFSDFSKKSWYLFASKLYDKAVKTLENDKNVDKGIPGLDAKCIKFIINRKECICGAEIVEGTSAYNRLKELENYIPPISIGTQITNFKSKINDLTKSSNLVIEKINSGRELLNNLIIEATKIENDIEKLDKELANATDLSVYVQKQKELERDIANKTEELGSIKQKITQLTQEISSHEKSRNVGIYNKKAILINKYIYCAKWCYNEIEKLISEKETEYRKSLETKINEIFNTIFNVEYNLELMHDYGLNIKDGDITITDSMKLSGAQATIIAFAFIGAVIELSKDSMAKNNGKDQIDIVSEPYPLVLDAPSSNFDKDVISKFCSTIPRLSQQTIILVKDTDGEYIEKELADKIGKRYLFKKINAFHTEIKEG